MPVANAGKEDDDHVGQCGGKGEGRRGKGVGGGTITHASVSAPPNRRCQSIFISSVEISPCPCYSVKEGKMKDNQTLVEAISNTSSRQPTSLEDLRSPICSVLSTNWDHMIMFNM
jgi:hypothetical protein